MFNRRATSASVLIGGLAGSFVSYYVAYHTRIGFLWPSSFGLVATVAIASLLAAMSDAFGGSRATGAHLTWSEVMRPVAGESSTWR
jgi:hypothetical protein